MRVSKEPQVNEEIMSPQFHGNIYFKFSEQPIHKGDFLVLFKAHQHMLIFKSRHTRDQAVDYCLFFFLKMLYFST